MDVSQIDVLSKKLYEPSNADEQRLAEQELSTFISSANGISQLLCIMEQSSSQHTLFFVSSALNTILRKHFSSIPASQIPTLHSNILNFLVKRVDSLPPFVTAGFARSLVRLDKLAWLDIEEVRAIVSDITHIFQMGTPIKTYLALLLFKELVQEMNTPQADQQLSLHRRRSQQFKVHLPSIFEIALNIVFSFVSSPSTDTANLIVLREALDVITSVLSFDFIGTCAVADSADDIATVHAPREFRPFFENPQIITAFFALQKLVPADEASKAFNCILRIASITRSIFASKEYRSSFLHTLMQCTYDLLTSGVTPAQFVDTSPQLLHDMARLFVRIKTNFEFSELHSSPLWTDWLKHLAEFSVQTFALMKTGDVTNAVFFFLSFWDRLVTSVPYAHSSNSNPRQLIDDVIPRIFSSYVNARLEMATEDYDDDEFDSSGGHLTALATIARLQYSTTASHILSAWQTSIGANKALALAWLIRLIGSLLSSRLVVSTKAGDHDEIDVQLACLVLQFLTTQLQVTQSIVVPKLDYALILFLRQFCRAFLSDKVTNSPMYKSKLEPVLGTPLQDQMINIVLQKIISNLHHHPDEEHIIDVTLEVFRELVTGYASSKMVKDSSATKQVLLQHRSSHLRFLTSRTDSDARYNYYFILGRILFDDLHVSNFSEFVKPIDVTIKAIQEGVSGDVKSLFGDTELRFQVISLFKDLRGLCSAILDKKFYPLFLTWLHNNHRDMIVSLSQVSARDPDLSIHILKFFEELACARSSRCSFKHHSATGNILFRDVSAGLLAFAENAKEVQVRRDIYTDKLKHITTALSAIGNALAGNYVNFGVCELYGDNSLTVTSVTLFSLMVSVPVKAVLEYPKSAKAVVVYCDAVCQYYPQLLLSLSERGDQYICWFLEFLLEGCKSLDSFVVSNSCSSLDSLLTYIYANGANVDPCVEKLKLLLRQGNCYKILEEIEKFLLNAVLFEDIQNQWSLTRPLLGLILVFFDLFSRVQQQIISVLLPEQQSQAIEWFGGLSENVKNNLEPGNRDVFAQNLTRLRNQLRPLVT
ncbi:hypothetical protein GEMRC1_004607 [Eukaryota sp. GEM-RC1]